MLGPAPPAGGPAQEVRAMSDIDAMRAVLSYTVAHRQPCWAIHTMPGSTIGGTSCRLIDIDGSDRATIEIANGDRRTVPVAEISMRGVN